ncbi:MAG TPA: lipopolysaccharide heptosyltransferase family protein, partial [Chromatiales bacterium]|nr:lipopolysaccharide heptosyltransferase family protein [Chromatiales bacterium]
MIRRECDSLMTDPASPMTTTSTPIRVLVIRAGALGDTVCASSIIEPLRHEFGNEVVIDWLAKAGMGEVFAADPRIHRVFSLQNRRLPIPFNRQKLGIVLASRKSPYDYVINLELGALFNDLVRLVQAKHKVGMPYQYFAEPPEQHAVDNLKLIYRSFLSDPALALAVPGLMGKPAARVKQAFGLPDEYFVLVPANSHSSKHARVNHRAWPIGHRKRLMELMQQQGKAGVIIGSRDDRAWFHALHPLPDNFLSLAGKTRFPELIGIIEAATGVITTDTGPAHIAAAVNTPVYALI